jgi:excisionase family DNA binding protein
MPDTKGMETQERLLTPQEVATMAGVSAATIKREVRRGRLRAIRVGDGRLIRIPEDAWRTYLAERGVGERGRAAARPGRLRP